MIKGILFDKDGTLIEFNGLWIDVTVNVMKSLLREFQLSYDLLPQIIEVLGINENGEVNEDSVLASETTLDSAQLIAPIFAREVSVVVDRLNHLYYEETVRKKSEIRPIGNVKQLFLNLKKKGYKIGVVTADNLNITNFTLRLLELQPYVDFIAAADTHPKKPSPEALYAFCQQYTLKKEEVIHIGDTVVDMQFGKHANKGVAVLSGTGSYRTLRQYTDVVLPDIHSLLSEDGRLVIEV